MNVPRICCPRWLLVCGGPAGGVCALDRWDASASFVEVIHPTELDIQIQSVAGGGFWDLAVSHE